MRRTQVLVYAGCLFVFLLIGGCGPQSDRKIKLASEASVPDSRVQTVSSILQVAPDQQHAVAILPFENQTDDTSLGWLSRGLADMLTAELSQSAYLNVVPMSRLHESAKLSGMNPKNLYQLENALKAADKANVKTVVRGSFVKDKEGLKIYGVLQDVKTSAVLKKEFVQGANLERIFSMVSDLSGRLAADLRGNLERPTQEKRPLSKMTVSLEAFKCYSKALDNLEKYFYAEADQCLKDAIALDSTFASAYLLRTKTKASMGNFKAIGGLVRNARRHAAKLSESDELLLRFREAQINGDIPQMLVAMQELLSYEPNDLETRLSLAEMRYGMGQLDRAIEEYELILDLDPTRKRAYNQLAYAYARRGDFTTAHMYLDKYAEIAPNEPNPYDSRGDVLRMEGRFEEAVEQFKTALEKLPSFYESSRKLSEVFGELDDLERLKVYSDQWLAGAPGRRKQSAAYTKRAASLWRFGKIQEAAKTLALAREFAPNYVSPALVAGEMYKSIGDTTAAHRFYESYFKRYKNLANSDSLELDELFGSLKLLVESDLPPEQVIPALKRFAEKEKRPFLKQMIELHLGILYLKIGEYELAQRYSDSQSREFLDFLVQFPTEGRSMTWKYPIEAIRLEPKRDDPDLSYLEQMIEAGLEAGRKDIEVMGKLFLAQYQGKYDQIDDLRVSYKAVGIPLEDHWRIIGPFENRAGFHRIFPPENGIDLTASFKSRGRNLTWQKVSDGAYDGYVDLRTILKHSSWGVAYGTVSIHSPEKRKVQLRIASDEACKLWFNNELVWQIYRTWESPIDRDIVSVVLHPGDNKILIKVTNSMQDWGFYFRVTDENGDGFEDIEFHAPGEANEFASHLGDSKVD